VLIRQGGFSMARRELTPEEIEKSASKEWKKPSKKKAIVTISEENGEINIKKIKNLSNLTGPVTEEGKKKSLANLRAGGYPAQTVKHGGYIKRILSEDELDFYNMRKESYLSEFDLNQSSDEIVLNLVLIDEVIVYRLLKRLNDKPSLLDEISRPLNEAQQRLHKNLDGLAMLRKQRINQDRMDKEMSIIKLANDIMKNQASVLKQRENEVKEEEEFLRQKALRDRTINVDFEEVEEDGIPKTETQKED